MTDSEAYRRGKQEGAQKAEGVGAYGAELAANAGETGAKEAHSWLSGLGRV